MATKKIILGALLFIVTGIGIKVLSHARMSKEEKVKHITEQMVNKLFLSQEQQSKVYQINMDRSNGHEAAYRQRRKKEVILKVVDNWKLALKQVLTKEQAQKLSLS